MPIVQCSAVWMLLWIAILLCMFILVEFNQGIIGKESLLSTELPFQVILEAKFAFLLTVLVWLLMYLLFEDQETHHFV